MKLSYSNYLHTTIINKSDWWSVHTMYRGSEIILLLSSVNIYMPSNYKQNYSKHVFHKEGAHFGESPRMKLCPVTLVFYDVLNLLHTLAWRYMHVPICIFFDSSICIPICNHLSQLGLGAICLPKVYLYFKFTNYGLILNILSKTRVWVKYDQNQ